MPWIDQEGRMTGLLAKLVQAWLLLTVLCLVVPLVPAMPAGDLDPSWMLGMNQAVAQGLAFGREMVFTFGPYAAIYTHTYHPATDLMALVGAVHVALCFWLAIFVLTRGVKWTWLLIFGVALMLLSYSRDALLLAYPVLVGLACHEVFQQMRRDEVSGWPLLIFMAMLFSALGLLPLIKGSLLILCVLVMGASIWALTIRGDWRAVLIAVLVPPTTMGLYWCAAGQQMNDLQAYFLSMAPIISGYTDAMSRDGFVHELVLYGLSACLLLYVVFKRERSVLSGMFIVLAGALFLVFKAGYVRHDPHALAAASFVLFAAVLVAMIGSAHQWTSKILLLSIGSATLLLIASVAAYSVDSKAIKATLSAKAEAAGVSVEDFKLMPRSQQVRMLLQLIGPLELCKISWHSLYFPMSYSPLWEGFAVRVLNTDTLSKQFQASLDAIKQHTPLPLLRGSVDIYSFHQSALIASGNQWHPRPVFQSYSVYTPSLALLNFSHLNGPSAPEHVLFRVEAIDGRLPATEEGVGWGALTHRYRAVQLYGDLLHLRKIEAAAPVEALPIIAKASADMGQAIAVPAVDGVVYAEVDIKPTLLGRLFGLLYKSNPLHVAVKLADGSTRTYRLVPGMVKTGFLISPLIENTADFSLLFGSTQRLASKQVMTMTVTAAGRMRHWMSSFDVVFRADSLTKKNLSAYAKAP